MSYFVTANTPGMVARVTCNVGDTVEKGQEVVVLNCMKMEIPHTASAAGTVKTIKVAEWDEVEEGSELIEIED